MAVRKLVQKESRWHTQFGKPSFSDGNYRSSPCGPATVSRSPSKNYSRTYRRMGYRKQAVNSELNEISYTIIGIVLEPPRRSAPRHTCTKQTHTQSLSPIWQLLFPSNSATRPIIDATSAPRNCTTEHLRLPNAASIRYPMYRQITPKHNLYALLCIRGVPSWLLTMCTCTLGSAMGAERKAGTLTRSSRNSEIKILEMK